MNLSEMIGDEIAVKIPFLKPDAHVNVILEAVENSGIWINSAELNEQILSSAGIKASQKSLALFVPFAKIDFVFGVSERPHLSEASLQGSNS